MPFDALTVSALREEFNRTLANGRIEKIHQPQKDLVNITIYHPFPRQELWALLSTHPRFARGHLLSDKLDNPLQPSAFCMLLRKYLGGGRILSIDQPSWERMLIFRIENLDSTHGLVTFSLIFEAMGRFSNLILVDHQGVIIDALKRFPEGSKGARVIFPGQEYQPPPAPTRFHPSNLTIQDLQVMIDRSPSSRRVKTILGQELLGLSEPLTLEILVRAGIDPQSTAGELLSEKVKELYQSISEIRRLAENSSFSPCVYLDDHSLPIDLYPYHPRRLPPELVREVSSISQAVEETIHRQQFKAESSAWRERLLRKVSEAKKKTAHKKEKQLLELTEAKDADLYRVYGELLTANQYRIQKGLHQVELEDYYHPEGKSLLIKLDPRLSANENAQYYFRKYSKAKKGKAVIAEQLKKTDEETHYLESLEDSLQNPLSREELEEIEEEMREAGLTRRNKKTSKQRKPATRPAVFRSDGGLEILVGRNNRQNDLLTMKIAGPRDLWLHTREIPGSHVLIRTGGRPIDGGTLNDAANLAVYFSKARDSSKVPVDYTEKRYLRKPSGAKPGFVLYEKFKTMVIDPDPVVLERLLSQGKRKSGL